MLLTFRSAAAADTACAEIPQRTRFIPHPHGHTDVISFYSKAVILSILFSHIYSVLKSTGYQNGTKKNPSASAGSRTGAMT